MKMLNCYCVFDKKGGTAFDQPYFAVNHATAIRLFGVAVRDTRSLLSQYSEDFALMYIGQFDDQEQLKLIPLAAPELIAQATDLIPNVSPNE